MLWRDTSEGARRQAHAFRLAVTRAWVAAALLAVVGSVPSAASGDSPGTTQCPKKPKKARDDLFVAKDLNKGCRFSADGRITFKVNVERYVGELNDNGELAYPDTLVGNGVVSAKAKLRLAAYDVDESTDACGCWPESDAMRFNGRWVGSLSGKASQKASTVPATRSYGTGVPTTRTPRGNGGE